MELQKGQNMLLACLSIVALRSINVNPFFLKKKQFS
jgi:hypothetical protein